MRADTKRILVLCTGNSCRSQMAEGYLRLFARGRVEVYSAGVVAHGVNTRAAAVMQEDGVDISGQTSKTVNAVSHLSFDHVITVCDNAKENCPWFPSNAERVHHDLPDPARAVGTEAEIMEQFRDVRDMIKLYCAQFIRARFS